jgi:hypothetical protein
MSVGDETVPEPCVYPQFLKALHPDHATVVAAYLSRIATGAVIAPRRGRGFDRSRIARDILVPPNVLHAVWTELGPHLACAPGDRRPVHMELPTDGSRDQRATPSVWKDPVSFQAAFDFHIRRNGDTVISLHRYLAGRGGRINRSTLAVWRRGAKAPQSEDSLRILNLVEEKYGLPKGYFAAKHAGAPRALRRAPLAGVPRAEGRRLAWHLPHDFSARPVCERDEILDWVRTVIVSGATDYRRYQAAALQHRYGLQFRVLDQGPLRVRTPAHPAPEVLNAEMADYVRYKTSTLTPAGYKRRGHWGAETAAQRMEHLGLLFGAMAAPRDGPIAGEGVPPSDLTFGLLAFPAVWDWYVRWREARRGFYTAWEVDLLVVGASLTREETGWLRQTPAVAERLKPIPGLVSANDIDLARHNWEAACERNNRHCLARIKEIECVARVHRDPFEPILVILEAESPLGEYRKITDEILRRMPDTRRYPKAAAEAVRAFLMLRLGLHTGLRQKNLRQLLLSPRGKPSRSDRQLETLKRGEFRWNEKVQGWEVYIPAVAFKNATSSFFGGRPFRLVLPDLSGLYEQIDRYLGGHRATLLAGATDPGTFFVKSAKATSRSAEYSSAQFYEAWRLAIQRYGIFNPYTGRGAIKGLLPHGPHNIRDVLATHILKQTGSYEQASYAIQDTPDMVAEHYGRFLPQDKASLAAQVLNKAWV